MRLALVYRGPLATCNYRCGYCAVHARRARRAEDGEDGAALDRFVRWVEGRAGDRLSILFSPRGEALIHARYREALRRLAALPQVRALAAQTNLSLDPALLAGCDPARTRLWATFHPTETSVEAFAARSRALLALRLRHTVVAVAIPARLPVLAELSHALPRGVRLQLQRRHGARPLSPGDLACARALDPRYQDAPPRCRGRLCPAGARSLHVDGRGDAHRCLSLPARLGNLYADGPGQLTAPGPTPCPLPVCRCPLDQRQLASPCATPAA